MKNTEDINIALDRDFAVLTPMQVRKLAMYSEITALYKDIKKRYPEMSYITAVVWRTVNESAKFADFRRKFPEYPKTRTAVNNIITGKTSLQRRIAGLNGGGKSDE